MRVFNFQTNQLALAVAALVIGASAGAETLSDGSVHTISTLTKYAQLDIQDNAQIVAPEGYDVTMTVNGVNVPLAPGSYEGEVILTPTKNFLVKYPGYKPYHYRAALVVNDGEVQREQSVLAALKAGRLDDRSAEDVSIISREERFNGIIVDGDSQFTINGLKVDFTGNGGNDFSGWGAAVASLGASDVTVNGADIVTTGAIRTALFIGDQSTMRVNHSKIEVFSGQLPEGYTFSIAPGAMMEVPYGLGLEGNVRATNLIDEATVYYDNTHIIAHGWGALSSDGNGPTRMYVSNSLIETKGSGYGAYANGDSHDYFSNTVLNVVDYGVVCGGPGWVTLTDGSILNSEKIGVMMHQGAGGSLLRVEKGSEINSKNTAVQIKGRGADVVFDNAKINAGNGILVQAMANDDPIMREMAKSGPMPFPEGMDPSELPPPTMPGAEAMAFSPDVNVNIRNSDLAGDIAHALLDSANMSVYLKNSSLTGGISTSVTHPSSGSEPTRETFSTVGEVDNEFTPLTGENQLSVFLENDATWIVDKTSYIHQLVISPRATLKAASEKNLTMLINGLQTKIAPGVYTGAIILEVVE